MATGLVLALALSACGAGGGRAGTTESGLTRLVIDYSATANNAQLSLGFERGIFERHGIEIEQVPGSGTSANSVALLRNGQINLAVTEITAVPAVHADFPVRIVTSLVTDHESPQGDAFSLVVPGDSPIRSFADLAGRTVAVNALESFFDLTLREAVRPRGRASWSRRWRRPAAAPEAFGVRRSAFGEEHGEEIARRLRGGMTSVNDALAFSSVSGLPFGGRGDSGYGRKHGDEGLLEFAYPHAITVRTGPPAVPTTTFDRPEPWSSPSARSATASGPRTPRGHRRRHRPTPSATDHGRNQEQNHGQKGSA